MEIPQSRSISEDLLVGLFDQKRWSLATNAPWWQVLRVPTWEDCAYLIKYFKPVLAQWASTKMAIYLEYDQGRICQINQLGEIMDAQIPEPLSLAIGGPMRANRALLDVFGQMLSSPERSLGLVRLADERQISVSGGVDGKYLVGASVDQANQWKRSDYWHPEDLSEFNRACQQSMSTDSDQWFEYRYRSFDPLAPADQHGPDFCDFEFISRYRLIEGPGGTLYHLGENIDMIEITTPE